MLPPGKARRRTAPAQKNAATTSDEFNPYVGCGIQCGCRIDVSRSAGHYRANAWGCAPATTDEANITMHHYRSDRRRQPLNTAGPPQRHLICRQSIARARPA